MELAGEPVLLELAGQLPEVVGESLSQVAAVVEAQGPREWEEEAEDERLLEDLGRLLAAKNSTNQ